MRGILVPTFKFVGTISLGLLTGVSYTTATQSSATLLSLPAASIASTATAIHSNITATHSRTLASLSAASFFLAYALSPSRGRHPYLAWVGLTICAGSAAEWYMSYSEMKEIRRRRAQDILSGAGDVNTSGSRSPVSEEGYEDIRKSTVNMQGSAADFASQDINGEDVRKSVESWRGREVVKGAVNGLAFAMAVVGIWGDRVSMASRKGCPV